MNEQYLLYGLIGIVALYICIKLLKWPIKILINGIIGVVLLYVVNIITSNLGMIGLHTSFTLPINHVTALIAGFLGIPGVVAIALIVLFL
ncbi:pro-sigmaK processing inhibitor BofA family protein [uncultured Clostridium sp.]|uniref:pro-sigmaK processing inhibitor BofA family protein n=1 Tax=uncultured Clostridium sp. TaxID=59620 RepID=UPI0025F42068|nr:pro-sigmaK processing inhibitor BofA family protein [uncultured Clostridium sp.]